MWNNFLGNNNQSQTSDDSRTPLKSRRQRTSARGDSGGNRNSASSDDDDIGTGQSAGAPRQGVDVTGKDMLDTSSKRRKIDVRIGHIPLRSWGWVLEYAIGSSYTNRYNANR